MICSVLFCVTHACTLVVQHPQQYLHTDTDTILPRNTACLRGGETSILIYFYYSILIMKL